MKKLKMMMSLMTALLIVPTVANGADDALPGEPKSAEEVLDRYLKAVGGSDAVRAIKSRVTKSETHLDPYGVTGKVEAVQKEANRYFEAFALDNVGSFTRGYDGNIGWSKSPFDGIKEQTGLSLANAKEDAELHLPARMKEVFPSARSSRRFPGPSSQAEATLQQRFRIWTESGLPSGSPA